MIGKMFFVYLISRFMTQQLTREKYITVIKYYCDNHPVRTWAYMDASARMARALFGEIARLDSKNTTFAI